MGRAVDDNIIIFKGTPEQKTELLMDLQGYYVMKLTDPATVVLGIELVHRDLALHTIKLR